MTQTPCSVPTCSGSEDSESLRLACRVHWYQAPIELRADYWLAFREKGVRSDAFLAAGEALVEFFSTLDAERSSS